jgi:hypothetical protein
LWGIGHPFGGLYDPTRYVAGEFIEFSQWESVGLARILHEQSITTPDKLPHAASQKIP